MTDNSANPSLEFCGLRIYATRKATRVTGRAEFPQETHNRTSVQIDYHSRRPPQSRDTNQNRDSHGADSSTSDKARLRYNLVRAWRAMCRDHPEQTQTALAAAVAASTIGIKCSPSSLRGWAKKLDTEGIAGLEDRYVPRPRKAPTFDSSHARDALLLCAWWSYRIGTIARVDTKTMAIAVGLIANGYLVADLIATVDCYYGYKCDRAKYPFKPFGRWVRHDLAKWIQRAASDADFARAMTGSVQCPPVPGPQARRRETRNRPTRQAIKKLSAVSSQPSVTAIRNPQSPIPNPQSPQSAIRNPKSEIHASRWASNLGQPHMARQLAGSVDSGMPALIANKNPQTMAESLALLDDSYRVMLLRAAQGDRDATKQALATIALWWDLMPQTIRNNIDVKMARFQREQPHVPDNAIAARKLAMLLPNLRNHRCGAQRLSVAARLPA